MSTCDITSGFTLGCRDNTGGIANLYILSGSITSVTDASEGLISGITGSGEFYKFELFRQTSDFTEAITSTPENGTVFYEQTLNAVFFKLQSSTRNQVKVLAQNPNLKIIVETTISPIIIVSPITSITPWSVHIIPITKSSIHFIRVSPAIKRVVVMIIIP